MRSNRLKEEILGWTSVVIGFPSFIALFVEGSIILGIAVIFLMLACWAILWLRHQNNVPDFTNLEVTQKLVIDDKDRNSGVITHSVKIRANRDGVQEFCFSGIGSDGAVDVNMLRIDSKTPDLLESRRAGRVTACKRFSPMRKGDEKTISMTFPVKGAFSEEEESLELGIRTETRSVTMIVEFPAERPALETWATAGRGSIIEETINKPQKLEAGKKLVLKVDRPDVGKEYGLFWVWATN